ncbi:dihydrofolate reductase family protein [Microlunatus speluncae]|uniref:dihydrofolate reductase family protein n=1 Tax=Microlunatus speluncae TaxID=2594267 RepID=UPI0012661A97|nr:dihydrofolate reductase family protein [Microlunatus speluncae]
MGKIRVHEFISLDGSFEDPSFTFEYGWTDAMFERMGAITAGSDALLLGRTTFEGFAPAWKDRTAEEDPGAAFFNDSTKYVVSSTLEDPESQWQNSTVIGGYDPDVIRKLKAENDLYVSGSGTLVRAMLADGLIDELHLLTYPVVLGTGARLFPEGTDKLPLSLINSEAYDNGVLHLVFGPAAA